MRRNFEIQCHPECGLDKYLFTFGLNSENTGVVEFQMRVYTSFDSPCIWNPQIAFILELMVGETGKRFCRQIWIKNGMLDIP